MAAWLVVSLQAATAHAADVSVAVLGIEAVEVPDSLAQSLTEALRQRVSAAGGLRAVAGKDLVELKMVFNCDSEAPACMAQAGKSIGADKLLYGTVKKGPRKTLVVVALKLLDVRSAAVEKFINDTVARHELTAAGTQALATRWCGSLLEGERRPTLTVASEPSGATVTLDGNNAGRTPLTLRDVPSGNHTVVLSLPGRTAATRTVDLRPGAVQDLTVTLEPEATAQAPRVPLTVPRSAVKDIPEPPPLTNVAPLPPPPSSHPGRTAKIVALATLIGAVASGAVQIYTYTTYRKVEDTANREWSMDEAMKCTNNLPVSGDHKGDCQRGKDLTLATNALWGVTGGLAAASAISFGIGEYQSQKAKKERGAFGVMRQTLRVAPLITNSGGGLSAHFEF